MVAVLDVITNLEKFPITKEALEETRLGKLINDVRKKTKDEDLAKRAKKLLRNWQKLIEPCQNETPSRSVPSAPGSANGGAHGYRADVIPPAAPSPGKVGPELKARNDVHNTYSPKAEKSSGRKRKGEQRDAMLLPAKIPKTAAGEPTHAPPATNGVGGSPEPPAEREAHPAPEFLENDRHGKIPVNAVRPHSSSPGLTKAPGASSLIRTAVLQQHPAKSPRCPSHSPRSAPHEAAAGKRSSTYAPKAPPSSAPVPSASPLPRPSASPVRQRCAERAAPALHPQQSTVTPEPPAAPQLRPEPGEPHGHSQSSEAGDSEGVASGPEGKRRKKYRSRDYTVNLHGQAAEDRAKPVRLKERRLTFDPVTGQIRPLTPKETHQDEKPRGPVPPDPPTVAPPPQKPLAPLPSPFQQTNWKELSRNEIIQSYLNLQSNMLTSSGAQTPGAHFFMNQYLKQEERDAPESRKTHVLVPSGSETDLPGVTRDVRDSDLHRIHKEHWPGVNGCSDTQGKWYDWTECISLDPHGDESKLNVLPYVCLD
ncbi:mediator of RNA polymerase II transcription subunit 26 isoform X2 [Denticeps clupeoides]|nr:mediator of RNA polymerase II transcription subunit 26-like isoform X2 [Denticeps clupeoides]